MFIIRHRVFFFALTGLIVAAALGAIAVFGLRFGIDFTGGTLVQASYASGRPDPRALHANLEAAGFSGFSVREAGTNDYILRAQNLTAAQRAELPQTLSVGSDTALITSLTEVGPTIGTELRNKAYVSIILVLIAILLFIAFAFRKVSRPVSSWVYGTIALVTLLHDVIVPTGFFALLGHFTGVQVDTLFVTAILTVLGFSVHDTIVVFDRVRENLRRNHEAGRKEDFADTAGRALNQTLVRSLNTSLTVVITLVTLWHLGPVSTKDFALTLLVGIIAGTYSSIFLATPLLVTVAKRQEKR
jgi:preprotein translocase subunit SecF